MTREVARAWAFLRVIFGRHELTGYHHGVAPMLNAWGEPVDPPDETDPFHVPEEEREDVDEGPLSDAREGGDDVGSTTPDSELPGYDPEADD